MRIKIREIKLTDWSTMFYKCVKSNGHAWHRVLTCGRRQ
jgi:hypothetical protein